MSLHAGVGLLALLLVPLTSVPADAALATFQPGASGIGDNYYPRDGNGGYDVARYGLELEYHPDTDLLEGVATITLSVRQDLSRFNLDLDGLTVHSVTVAGAPATFQRGHGELKITPAHGIRRGSQVQVVVDYSGVPRDLPVSDGGGGFLETDDGATVTGEPHVAATWFPVNDHPRDKARYHFAVSVPDGLEVVANGNLVSHDSDAGLTRWVWNAPAPMASYLATIDIGEFELDEYHDAGGRPGGIDYVDAIDPDLLTPVSPHTGTRFAISQRASSSYKRLSRVITVPNGGATMTFWVDRATEQDWDFFAVEAHTDGQDDWTTLPDANLHTTTGTGNSCPGWHDVHPFLTHFQTDDGNGGCTPTGTSGAWNAATGSSDGWEQWSVDLSDFADSDVEVAISVINDDTVQARGVFVDDIVVSTGEGSTSFETDGDELDGWTVPGPPAGSPGNDNDWISGAVADAPPTPGQVAQDAFARQPEILEFLASRFGPYPFVDSGGIVDDLEGIGFALENQTRPVYNREVFGDPDEAVTTVVHELAHQWYGDRNAVDRWKHIWLNEGFATYAEWLWSAHEGGDTPQEIFEDFASTPANDDFWHLRIGDPRPAGLFDGSVYYRGAMTLQALRNRVGNADFFTILRRWGQGAPGRRSTTENFQALAERVSGRQLDGLFHEWLFTAHRPAIESTPEATAPTPKELATVVGD